MPLHDCCVGRARSLARIKVSAFGAGDRGFKSHRARSLLGSEPSTVLYALNAENLLIVPFFTPCLGGKFSGTGSDPFGFKSPSVHFQLGIDRNNFY